tara:strand:- start:5089 stop:5478 length:390 start_codon:yes stop_codon:yes gene_type:complete
MILFRPQAENRFTCIPREYVTSAFMTIRDDSTNVLKDYILAPRVGGVGNIEIDNDRFTVYNSTYTNMVEGHFYDMTIYKDGTKEVVIFKDRIFCTEQKLDIQNEPNYFYKLNKDQYQEYDGFNNDYIVV